MEKVNCPTCNQPIDVGLLELGGNKCPSCGGRIKFEKLTVNPDAGQIQLDNPSDSDPTRSSGNAKASADDTKPSTSEISSQREAIRLLSSYASKEGLNSWNAQDQSFEEWELGLLCHYYRSSPDEDLDVKTLLEIGFRRRTIDNFAIDIQRIGPEGMKKWVKDGRMTFFTSTANVLIMIAVLMLIMIMFNTVIILTPDPSMDLLYWLAFSNFLAIVLFLALVSVFNSDAKDLNEFLYQSK